MILRQLGCVGVHNANLVRYRQHVVHDETMLCLVIYTTRHQVGSTRDSVDNKLGSLEAGALAVIAAAMGNVGHYRLDVQSKPPCAIGTSVEAPQYHVVRLVGWVQVPILARCRMAEPGGRGLGDSGIPQRLTDERSLALVPSANLLHLFKNRINEHVF